MTRSRKNRGSLAVGLGILLAAMSNTSRVFSTETDDEFTIELPMDDPQSAGAEDGGGIDEVQLPGSFAAESARGLFRDFTFKLSHQFYAQVNPHTVFPNNAQPVRKPEDIENNRFSLLIRYQNPFARGWVIQGNAQAKAYLPGDYEHGTRNKTLHMEYRLGDTEYRINELFVQRSFASHSFKLGRQTVVWGETLGNSVLDIINTSDFRDSSIIEIEDARLNQWMLSWDYYWNDKRLSTFFNFYPEFNPPARRGSPFHVPGTPALPDPERDEPLFEVGSQLQWTVEGSDFALMAAYLYENQLRYELSRTSPGKILAKKNDYWLLGASANRAFGRLMLRLDLAYSHGVLADTLLAPQAPFFVSLPSSLPKNQLGTSFGFEYAIDNDQRISVSILARYFLNKQSGLSPGERLATDDIFGTWLIRYSYSLMNGDLLLWSTMNGTLNGDRALISGAATYTLDDHWSVMAQAIGTWSSPSSATALLDRDIRLGFNVSYSF
ncbi:hypothetical protein sS8_4517 [Methylocaldum marinum]|uniref:Alginate export domain-containing protein n=2 Tax=Methylocaldum marinum TaxID=1432792 RepID=A0A250KXU3_9GAMM|nr:hypothetical protein sS8_4517 [Methylocaldum marinum]